MRLTLDTNLARQAELALERQGDHDSLFFEGKWHSSGQMADRAAARSCASGSPTGRASREVSAPVT